MGEEINAYRREPLNQMQRNILFGVAGVIVLMVLFPPWEIDQGTRAKGLGYAFLVSRPHFAASMDIDTLFMQLVAACVVGGILAAATGGEGAQGGNKMAVLIITAVLLASGAALSLYSKKQSEDAQASYEPINPRFDDIFGIGEKKD